MYLAVAEQRGVPWAKLRGTIQNDILKEYIAQNEYIFPPEPSMRLVMDMSRCAPNMPQWNPISISGYHIREAGSTAAQELAFTLADGIAYVEAAVDRGLDVDASPRDCRSSSTRINDFFEEIAKYRAARRIWARTMRDRFGAKNPRSWWLRFHAQTAGASLTAQQPEINVIRTTIQALAAVLGGTQIVAHQLTRRGAGAAFRKSRYDRAAHPAGDRRRERCGQTPSIRWAARTLSRR